METYLQHLRGLASRNVLITNRYPAMKAEKLDDLFKKSVHQTMIKASLGADETKDFGGDLYLGGNTFNDSMVKQYIREILDDCYSYLQDINGKVLWDMPHIFIASYALQYKYARFHDSTKVLAAGLLLNSKDIVPTIAALLKNRGKRIKLGFNYSTYDCKKCDYSKKYMMYLTIPNGYNCYLYEPHNIAQIAFLMTLGMNVNDVGNYIGSNKNGLLIGSIPQSVETSVSDTIFRNRVLKLDGFFGNQFLDRYTQAIRNKNFIVEGYNPSFYYYESIIPTMCKLMDSAFYQGYLHDINSNLDLTEEECFINYITPTCVSVCIRKDLDVNYVLPSVVNKLSIVNPVVDFTNVLNYC